MNLFDTCTEFLKSNGFKTIEIDHPFLYKEKYLFFNLDNYVPKLRLIRYYENRDYKYCLDYLTPFNNHWINIYKEYSPEELLDKIILNGLQIVVEKFDEFKKINNFFNNRNKTLVAVELELVKNDPSLSFFSSESAIFKKIDLKIYTIIKETYRYDYFRKGNYFYEIKREVFQTIFWRSDYIIDSYLQNFLLDGSIEYYDLESEINLDNKVEYSCVFNQEITELLKESYDSLSHLKYLITKGRSLNLNQDHKYFIESIDKI